MVQKKKTKIQKATPKKKRASVSSSVKKNDIRLSDMVDLAAEEFVKTIEIMAKLSTASRTKLKNSIKSAAKNILQGK
ncbi:hypothetical protein [Leptospira stimsonii]|uniref:Uncharacterized protein n=2 Tax=Leptospira stimsonii TaxID=2202203 RepID=A0A4V3JV71_9LEPT|nr:hypothetical protein [Leptospira stimsonii]RHX87588.1 hypothetical protein DLM78_00850 [Leptospira stimsonii]TGK10935.1 hypothetical protein EHO98_20465 [Leptospira stimsonii]TGM13655.1 hypothetical protein EHQ90_13420 [Leptospira stimsonii]